MREKFSFFFHLDLAALICITAFSAGVAGENENPYRSHLAGPPKIDLPLPSLRFDPESYELALQKSRAQCQDSPCKWWHDYVQGLAMASTKPAESCQLFSDLAGQSDFALQPVAAIHQAEICGQDQAKSQAVMAVLQKMTKDEATPRWLKAELSVAAVKAAKGAHSPEEIQLTLDALPLLHSQKFKIKMIQNTLADAADSNDPKMADLRHALYKLAPRLNRKNDDWWSVGIDSMAAHDYGKAIKAFKRVVKARQYSVSLRRLAYDYLKQSYKVVQDRVSALKSARQLFNFDLALFKRKKHGTEASQHLLSSGLSLARFDWTEHKTKAALAVLKQLQKALKNKVNLSDVFFIHARIDEELVKTNEALDWMNKALKAAGDSPSRPRYLWGYAWLNYKLGNYDKARSGLEDLLKIETDPGKQAQQRFWLAKTLNNLKLPDQATPLFEQIINEDPLSYYALLSYRELGKSIPPPGKEDPTLEASLDQKTKSGSSDPFFDWLISVGELRMAREALAEDVRLPLTPDGASEETENAMLTEYARAQEFNPVFSHIVHLSPSEQQKIFAEHPDLIFPRTYAEFVNEGAVKSGLWPEYIFSIMRQESGFDPLSVSPANAYGLLQLLPSAAKPLVSSAGVSLKDSSSLPDVLMDPHSNVLLGAELLRNYWEEFDGQFILTTAAYNASPEAVRNWVKTRYQGDPLVFIEDIPYEETRTYVKLVLRNFISYMRIDSGGLPITFPEWCLEGIQATKD